MPDYIVIVWNNDLNLTEGTSRFYGSGRNEDIARAHYQEQVDLYAEQSEIDVFIAEIMERTGGGDDADNN